MGVAFTGGGGSPARSAYGWGGSGCRQRAGRLPVIAWTHGTTGIAPECAPSALPDPFTAGALFVPPGVVERDWALAATDYSGLGAGPPHEYLVGRPTARAELDAVRAARQLDGLELSDTTVAWGHSQGAAQPWGWARRAPTAARSGGGWSRTSRTAPPASPR